MQLLPGSLTATQCALHSVPVDISPVAADFEWMDTCVRLCVQPRVKAHGKINAVCGERCWDTPTHARAHMPAHTLTHLSRAREARAMRADMPTRTQRR